MDAEYRVFSLPLDSFGWVNFKKLLFVEFLLITALQNFVDEMK